jgi:hypothetical protein
MTSTQEFVFHKWISDLEDANYQINLEMHSLLGVFGAWKQKPDEIVSKRRLDPSQFNEAVNAYLTKSIDGSQVRDLDWHLFGSGLGSKEREYYCEKLETDDAGLDTTLNFLSGSSVLFATIVKTSPNIEASAVYPEVGGPGLSDTYLEINNAVAEKFFGTQQQGKRVYLDMEDSVVQDMARDLELPGDPFEAFNRAIRENLYLTSKRSVVYSRFNNALADWNRSNKTKPPPHLALLAFFCRAAQRMQSDEQYSGSNYYVRYYEALGLANESSEAQIAQSAYRSHATYYFGLLNDWLTSNNYVFGRPTAYTDDRRRHVGLPIVQSLMRNADRVKLCGMFLAYELAPRSNLFSRAIRPMLEQWLPNSNVSAVLKRLSHNPIVMDQIADVAVQELSSWNGSCNDSTREFALDDTLRLSASVVGYPGKRLQLGLVVPSAIGLQGTAIEPVVNTPELIKDMIEKRMLEVENYGTENYAQIENTYRLDFGTILEHAFDLVGENGTTVKWSPKECVVLRKDPDMPGRFIEQESSELNTELILIVRRQYAKAVSDHLLIAGDEQFKDSTRDLPGCPTGWSVFTNVFITKRVNSEINELESLIPPQANFTKIDWEGGFKIPPNNSSWHISNPPQAIISAPNTADAAVEVVFRPFHANEGFPIIDKKTFEGNTVFKIPPQDTSGEITVKLFEPAESKTPEQRTLILVNSDDPLPSSAKGGNWKLAHKLIPHRHLNAKRYEESPSAGHVVGARLFGVPRSDVVLKWDYVDWKDGGLGDRRVTPQDEEEIEITSQVEKTPWEEMQDLPGWTAEGHLYKFGAYGEVYGGVNRRNELKSDLGIAVTQLAAERNLPQPVVVKAVEAALAAAYKRDPAAQGQDVIVEMDPSDGDVTVRTVRHVVEEVEDPLMELTADDAQELQEGAVVGDIIETGQLEYNPGRIAAQTANQVVMQRLREAERDIEKQNKRVEPCVDCGLSKHHVFYYWHSAITRSEQDNDLPSIEPGFTPKRSPIEEWKPTNGDTLLDALTYLKKGDWKDFQTLASFVNNETYFPDQLARDLDAMGHIELQIGEDRNYVGWATAPTTLVVDSSRSAIFMTGSRSREDIQWLKWLSSEFGGSVETSGQSYGRPSWIGITKLSEEQIQNIRVEILEKLSSSVPELLLEHTEYLSSLLENLPVIEYGSQQCDRFDPSTCKNEEYEYVPSRTGAYRFGPYKKVWAFDDGKYLRQCDWRTAKHLAAWKSKQPLIGFEKMSGQLRVPLGAELPGIFGRVATLCSGYAPIKHESYTLYRGVPEHIASGIFHRLYGQKG